MFASRGSFVSDPFSLLRQQIGSVFDQFGMQGVPSTGQIEDFSSAGQPSKGQSGQEQQSTAMASPAAGLSSALSPLLPSSLTRLVPQLKLDVVEQPDKYVLHCEAPGVKREQLRLTVEDGVLTVTAEKRDEHEERKDDKGYRVLRREIGYGTVTRSIRLPRDSRPDDVRARFDNGVLEIEIPRRPPAEKEDKDKESKGSINIQ